MTYTWHTLGRALALALIIPALLAAIPAAAQDDPAALVEARALDLHRQNLRLNSFTAWLGGQMGDPANAPRRTAIGDRFDNWTLNGFASDDDVSLADLQRPVLLNFWASWCPPCRAEFPHLVAIASAPDEYAFDVVFVNMSDTERDARAFLADYPQQITTTLDTNDRLALRASVDSIPTSLLIDRDGTVLIAHVGAVTPTVSAFFDAVAAAPGAGLFINADHAATSPGAILAPVSVDDAALLVPGETVQGVLDDAQFQQAYRFEGRAGDSVTLTMAADAGDLDPYLVLMTATGERLGENDDIELRTNTDAALNVTLPGDGTYLVVATRFLEAEGFSSGLYTLTLTIRAADASAQAAATPTAAPAITPQPAALLLAYGETGSAAITDAEYAQRWTFEGQAGDVIALVMARTLDADGGLDGYLVLEGPDGTTLLEVDDAHDSVMPAIDDYTLPVDGTYTIIATRFGFADGLSTGGYTLALNARGAAPAANGAGANWLPAGALPADLHLITYNDVAVGALDADNVDDWYMFQGSAGDVIAVHMRAGDSALDPFVILTTASGLELASNDDRDDATADARVTVTLPANATYLVRATRYGFAHGPSSGAYRLLIETDAAPPEAAIPVITALAYGDHASGTLSLENPRVRYTFTAQPGEEITVRVTGAEGLLPVVNLRGPDGDIIASDTNPADRAEALLQRVALPAAGGYTLEVTPKDLNTPGAYDLLLLGRAVPEIDAGAFVPAPDLDLEVVLIWASGADLDLAVRAPDDNAAAQSTRANDLCRDVTNAPVERVTWDAGTAGAGDYAITVTYRHNCAAQSGPVAFIVAIARDGAVLDLIGGTLAREGDRYTTTITLHR